MTNNTLRTVFNCGKAACLAVGLPMVLTLSAGCSNRSNSAGSPHAGTASAGDLAPDTVVATMGDKKYTLADVDESIRSDLNELDEQRYQMRRQSLEQMINQELVKKAAAKAGVPEEEYLKTNVESKVPAPSEETTKQFFEDNKGGLPPGAKYEEFKDRIVSFLNRDAYQKQAKQLFAELQKDGSVNITLAPPVKPRVEIEASGPSKGPADAKVTIVEFSDFECPFCSKAIKTVDEVMAAYTGKVRLVFRHFPLNFHKNAMKAAEASMCAQEQGKFWEYHDQMFAAQDKLEVAQLKEQAGKLGLDQGKFDTCLDSGKNTAAVTADMEAGKKAGVSGTPAFFINGIPMSGAQPVDEFKRIIDQELAAKS